MINFTQYFKEEKDIYVQNVAPGQVSLQFGRGDDAISFTLTRKRDPIILTNHVPFKKIAESTDFRKMLNRQPPLIRLLTEDEFNDYYKKKAKANKTTVDEVIREAETNHQNAKTKIAPPVSTAPKDDEGKKEEEEEVVNAEEVVNPRVIHLCHQVSPQIPAENRMKPNELLAQLKELSEEFKMDDYEYILANTSNKTIHNWAKSQQQVLAAAGVDSEAEAS